jgi:hypothetical protein
MGLGFADREALLVAIRSGLVPTDVAAGPARVAHAEQLIVVEPDEAVPARALAKLRAAGVRELALPAGARAVRCWAEALQPIAFEAAKLPSLVLFVTERVAQLLEVAAELVRLGCDRLELAIAGDQGVVRVVDPPTYTIVRALDRDHGLRVFAPDPAGQETVWTELGSRHPLAGQLRPEPGALLLVASDGWTTIRDEGWMPLEAALELAVPERAPAVAPGRLPARRKIELRLSTGRREVTSLWVIRDDAVARCDKLLEYLPEELVGRLMFAVSADDPPVVILRARTGRHPAPELSLVAEEYAPLHGMPDVYAPTGAIVEPPLRRERLRSTLGVGAREVMWLARVGTSRFRVERITDDAFTPLGEWADYVLHASAPALAPWVHSSLYDFAPYVSSGLEWASERSPREAHQGNESGDAKRKKKAGGPQRAAAEEVAQPPPATPAPKPSKAAPASEPPAQLVAIDAELAALEAEFIALDAPGDAPERVALLERLGHTYARLGRRRDAGLCFARAVWESAPEVAPARLETWIAADLGDVAPDRALATALALAVPSGDDVRAVAALTARVVPAVAQDPHRVTRWLDDHDGELDARALWLSRLGLATLAGGDPLLLAHARDRILARLAGGLPVERELPAFLRLAGRSGALGNASGEQLGGALEVLSVKLDKTKRKRMPLEAPAHLTNAYVHLLLAYGFARVGSADRAKGLVAEAKRALAPSETDPVHAYLLAAYSARVDQAIAGIASETPLSPELGAQLANLERFDRYKVDRLREHSRILEPLDAPDAIGFWNNSEKDARGPEFAALRDLTDPVQRASALDQLVERAAAASEADRERLIDGVLESLLELPESGAVPILQHAWPQIARVAEPRRALLYAESLVIAGHFGRTELVPAMLAALATAIRLVQGRDLERVLHHSLRALRRIGLRTEIAELLAEAEHALPAARGEALRGRLALAGGLAYLGETARALPIFEQARTALTENIMLPTRLELVRALALAYAQAPLQQALAGIADLTNHLRDISDSYGTNSHYCLSVLNFVDSLVLGITSDDLALGEAGRRFVEDDEYLIRRRLHRDLGGAS